MLNFLCFYVLLNAVKTDNYINIAPYGETFYYLIHQDKIKFKICFELSKVYGIHSFMSHSDQAA